MGVLIQRDGGGAKHKDKKCATKSCFKIFTPIGSGNHRYCPDCKTLKANSPAVNEDRKRKVLSPNDSASIPKLSRDDSFEAALDCEVETFLALDKEEMLDKFRSIFNSILENEDNLIAGKKLLEQQVVSLKKELDKVKIVLADKDVKLFDLTSNPPPKAKLSTANTQRPHSFADALKQTDLSVSQVPKKPILIARIGRDNCVPSNQVSDDKIDALLGLQGDGPVVQSIRKSDGKVVLTFKDEAERDRARDMIDRNPAQNLFHSVFVPRKIFPAIVRLHDVSGIQLVKGDDEKAKRQLQERELMDGLMKENETLRGELASARILYNRPNSSSFLVRIGVFSKQTQAQLLDKGRVLLDNKSHAVVEVDPNKEVRHCSRCQKYGHTQNFCKSKTAVCRNCSLEHTTESCTSKRVDFKCSNCQQQHCAGAASCPVHARAVAQYLKYIATN